MRAHITKKIEQEISIIRSLCDADTHDLHTYRSALYRMNRDTIDPDLLQRPRYQIRTRKEARLLSAGTRLRECTKKISILLSLMPKKYKFGFLPDDPYGKYLLGHLSSIKRDQHQLLSDMRKI